ncbi:MAG: hypothetical protein NXI07_15230, partial [bacterium]|nr:hypothetical protein [bacterium]
LRKHVLLGPGLLAPLPPLEGACKLIRSHHERYDGSGYPDGLAGEAEPEIAVDRVQIDHVGQQARDVEGINILTGRQRVVTTPTAPRTQQNALLGVLGQPARWRGRIENGCSIPSDQTVGTGGK